jgi:hypothetical protein
MNKRMVKSFFVLSVILSLIVCNSEPKVSVDNETQDSDLVAIELTTQVEGEFIGFDGENAVIDDQTISLISYPLFPKISYLLS